MPTSRVGLAALAGLAVLISCNVGSLFDVPPTKVIAVTPPQVVYSAVMGDTQHSATLAISSAKNAAPEWIAHRVANAAWLTITDSAGTAPAEVAYTLDPGTLAPATYRDTIVIVPSDAGIAQVRV